MATKKRDGYETLYFKVTDDKYELPIGVCTRTNIERVLHKEARYVTNNCSQYKRRGYGHYRAVEVEEDEE